MEKFSGYGLIIAKLNGKEIKCRTLLTAYGHYHEYYEPSPVEWMYGWTVSDYEIEEDTIELVCPNEFVLENGEDGEGVLTEFVKDLDVEWQREV